MTQSAARGLVPTEWLLVALGIVGLAGTWAQVFDYLALGFLPGNVQFWKETVATPASTFITSSPHSRATCWRRRATGP